MSPFLVLFILYFCLAWLATQPYVHDSNVTKLLDNLYTKKSVFGCFANCILFQQKILLLLLLRQAQCIPSQPG